MPYLASVNRLLTQKGTSSYSLKTITSNGFLDSDNPSKGPSTTSAVTSLLSFPGKYKNNQIDGDLVKKGDIKLYIDPVNVTTIPTIKDIIVHSGGDEWAIKDVDQWTKNDTVVLYVLQIRK